MQPLTITDQHNLLAWAKHADEMVAHQRNSSLLICACDLVGFNNFRECEKINKKLRMLGIINVSSKEELINIMKIDRWLSGVPE